MKRASETTLLPPPKKVYHGGISHNLNTLAEEVIARIAQFLLPQDCLFLQECGDTLLKCKMHKYWTIKELKLGPDKEIVNQNQVREVLVHEHHVRVCYDCSQISALPVETKVSGDDLTPPTTSLTAPKFLELVVSLDFPSCRNLTTLILQNVSLDIFYRRLSDVERPLVNLICDHLGLPQENRGINTVLSTDANQMIGMIDIVIDKMVTILSEESSEDMSKLRSSLNQVYILRIANILMHPSIGGIFCDDGLNWHHVLDKPERKAIVDRINNLFPCLQTLGLAMPSGIRRMHIILPRSVKRLVFTRMPQFAAGCKTIFEWPGIRDACKRLDESFSLYGLTKAPEVVINLKQHGDQRCSDFAIQAMFQERDYFKAFEIDGKKLILEPNTIREAYDESGYDRLGSDDDNWADRHFSHMTAIVKNPSNFYRVSWSAKAYTLVLPDSYIEQNRKHRKSIPCIKKHCNFCYELCHCAPLIYESDLPVWSTSQYNQLKCMFPNQNGVEWFEQYKLPKELQPFVMYSKISKRPKRATTYKQR